jgi:hypothetical protein
MDGQDRGVWLHAIGRDLDPAGLTGLSGVGGGPVRAISSAGLDAVVSVVDLAEFGEDALRSNLEDIAWLESTARAHHRVVTAAGGLGPVVPARLATMYHRPAGVADLLAERRRQLTTALDRLVGRAEWGVQAFAVSEASAAAGVPADEAAAGGAGTAYLRRRRAQLAARESGQQAALASAEAVHAVLAARAGAAAQHRPQDRRLSGEPGAMLLNGAYLVEARRATEFADVVTGLAQRHPAIRLKLTGPWPPYSFAALDLSTPAKQQERR